MRRSRRSRRRADHEVITTSSCDQLACQTPVYHLGLGEWNEAVLSAPPTHVTNLRHTDNCLSLPPFPCACQIPVGELHHHVRVDEIYFTSTLGLFCTCIRPLLHLQ
jgi:hypothetical protein